MSSGVCISSTMISGVIWNRLSRAQLRTVCSNTSAHCPRQNVWLRRRKDVAKVQNRLIMGRKLISPSAPNSKWKNGMCGWQTHVYSPHTYAIISIQSIQMPWMTFIDILFYFGVSAGGAFHQINTAEVVCRQGRQCRLPSGWCLFHTWILDSIHVDGHQQGQQIATGIPKFHQCHIANVEYHPTSWPILQYGQIGNILQDTAI